MKPKISVIVPIYNAEKYLGQCIDSVLRQKFTDLEILLVNDGSTDGSGGVCDQYALKDARVRVLHKENTGVSDTRNKALDIAQGDYLIFLDADDYWTDETFLEKFYNVAVEKNLDVLRGEYKYVTQTGEDMRYIKVPQKREKISGEVITSESFLENVILGEYFLVLSLIKRKAIENISFNTSRIFLEDAEFYLTMLLRNFRCAYLPVLFYAYRKHDDAVTESPNPKKLQDAFDFSRLCYMLARKTKNTRLQQLLVIEGIKNYKFDLMVVAESKRTWGEIKRLCFQYNLSELREKTIDSLKYVNISKNLICVLPVKLIICYYRWLYYLKKYGHLIKSQLS